jgi:hypothetical protein
VPAAQFAEAARAEGAPVGVISGELLYRHPLFLERRFIHPAPRQYDYSSVHCPVAEAERGQSLHFNHTVLLSSDAALDAFVDAIYKVTEHIGELKKQESFPARRN